MGSNSEHDASRDGTSTSTQWDEPIAIIGWANKFPGEATTSTAFWNMLCESRTAHGPFPKDRFNLDAFYHPDRDRSGTTAATHAHFLQQDPGAFDAPFFSFPPAEAATMDPQQRLVLEASYHAFESGTSNLTCKKYNMLMMFIAGLSIADVRGSNTSVYVGAFLQDYSTLFARDPENAPKYLATGLGGSIIPSRVSWFYDLRGEAMYIDTACSSSLTCLHIAVHSLRQGDSDMALVGGVSLMLAPDMAFNALSNMGFTSPDGRSYSFDSRANGYAKGEGVGLVLVKRLSDAIRDGNTIRAVLRATGTNQDGRTPGLTQPNGDAQEHNIRDIYARHGLDMSQTRFVEAHGTGTQVGDPIEAGALVRAFNPTAEEKLYIGAVKTNLGHLETVAGLAGLIKVCMILEKGMIPPNALYKTPNASIPLDKWNIKFPTTMTPWPTRGLRRASLNSFGYGGTNAHAVLDDAYHYLEQHGLVGKHQTVEFPSSRIESTSSTGTNELPNGKLEKGSDGMVATLESSLIDRIIEGAISPPLRRARIFIWSASDEDGLARINKVYRDHLENVQIKDPFDAELFMQNLSYTLSNHRSAFRWRTHLIAETIEELRTKLTTGFLRPQRASGVPSLAFIFTGQGAHWAGMGRELLCFDTFRASLEKANRVYQSFGADFDLMEELLKDEQNSNIDDPMISQSLSTALQIALIDFLAELNIYPEAILGHSSGEIAAAYCVGALDHESALRVSYFRGFYARALANVKTSVGSMIAVSLSQAECQGPMDEAMAATGGRLVVACENSPSNVTVSGDKSAVEYLGALMEAQQVFARQLKVPVAYHSPQMERYATEYREAMKGITGRRDTSFLQSIQDRPVPVIFSSVTGDEIAPEKLCQPSYWTTNSSSRVKFCPALQNMAHFLHSRRQPGSKADTSQLLTLEIGPHSALKRAIKDTLAVVSGIKTAIYENTLERKHPDLEVCLRAIAQMHCRGITVNLNLINYPGVSLSDLKLLVDLPPYPFNHSQIHWSESRISRNYRFRPNPRHELLGVTSNDWNSLEPHWRHYIKVQENPWIKDHRMDDANIYPASGMLVMVIEAARQLASPTHQIKAYALKDVQFIAALKVNDSHAGVEVQLRFQRPKHAGTGPSLEHNFAIYFESNNSWIQCSRGTIEVEVADQDLAPDISKQQREASLLHDKHQAATNACSKHISSEEFYTHMKLNGCDFGPAHQALQNIQYSTNSKTVCASIGLDDWSSKVSLAAGNPQPHVIHPTALDGVAQLAIAAFSQAGTAPFPTMVPVECRSMWVSNSLLSRPADARIQASARMTFQGFREADVEVNAFDDQGEVRIIVEGWRQMAITNLASRVSDQGPRKLCLDVQWKLDIDQLSPDALRRYCDDSCVDSLPAESSNDAVELALMHYAATVVEQLAAGDIVLSDLDLRGRQIVSWAENVFDEQQLQTLMVRTANGTKLRNSAAGSREYLDKLAQSNSDIALIVKIGDIPLSQSSAPMEESGQTALQTGDINVLIRDHRSAMSYQRLKAFMGLLSHKNPNLRIIEVGAGVESSMHHIIDAVAARARNGDRPSVPGFERFDCTNVSSEMLDKAQILFPDYRDRIHTTLFDVEKDPKAQSLEIGTYDVVYCDLVLRTLPNLVSALRNARKLLRSGGRLVIVEQAQRTNASALSIPDLFSSWLHVVEGPHPNTPLLSAAERDALLTACGFSEVEACIPGENVAGREAPLIMVASAIDEIAPSPSRITRTNIVLDSSDELQKAVALQLIKLSEAVDDIALINVGDVPNATLQDLPCIVLTELEKPWLKDLSSEDLETLKKIAIEASSILWITTGTGLNMTHPDQDLVSGFGRNIRSEQWDTKFTHLALERSNDAIRIAQRAHRAHAELVQSPIEQCEDVIREKNGQLYISRLTEYSTLNQHVYSKTVQQRPVKTTLADEGERALKLTIGAPGQIETLYMTDDEDADHPLAADEIEVRTAAVGLNFQDILTALGKIPAHNRCFGLEFAGTVARAGAETGFASGDRVAGITLTGACKTLVRTKACLVQKIDGNVSFESAAAMPVCWITAFHSLVTRAHLQQSESILIHHGASGIGQSAIQIAKSLGAEVFTTAATEEEQLFLVEQYAIAKNHVFSSRTDAFSDSIKEITDGKGVDVVLNSLTGKLSEVSWSFVAPLGRMVEIGKLDLLLGRSVPLRPLLDNISLIVVDLVAALSASPNTVARDLESVFQLHRAGVLNGPRPVRTWTLDQVESAFRSIAGFDYFGKAVVRMDDDKVPFMAVRSIKPPSLLPADATYVIAGGFGGLGRVFVKAMVLRGARNFLIPTASQDPSKATQSLLAEIAVPGVRVQGARCDISNQQELKSFLETSGRDLPPIRGCIQSTLALRDGLFANMSHSDWSDSIRPKVTGTWNLHSQLPENLNFFIVMSSIAAVVGSRAQANYAAGNAYQDAVVRHRLSRGQKALGFNMGPAASVGVAADRNLADQLLSDGFETTGLDECIALLDWALDPAHGCPDGNPDENQIVTGLFGVNDPRSRQKGEVYWLQRPAFSFLRHYQTAADGGENAGDNDQQGINIGKQLQSVTKSTNNDGMRIILDALVMKLSRALNIPATDVEPSKPIHNFGVDSLISLEIRYWFMKEAKANLAVFDIMGAASLSDLSLLAWERSSYNSVTK